YLELRFHAYVRRTASMTFLLQTLLYMAIVIYAPAITINQTTGLSPFIAIALCGSLCTLYTAIGGLRAVIWTDVFQALVIIISLITTAILGIQDGGGIQKVFKVIMEGDRLPYFNFDPDPRVTYTAWSTILGSTFIGIASFSFQQMIIQRIVSLPTKKAATAAVYCALPISLLILTLLCITGLVIYAKIADCNPIRSIYTYNNILPYFVTQMLNDYPGMRGLFVACIFCGALSTISSGLNSLSAVAFYDFIVPIYKKSRKTSISGSMSGHITMTLTFIFGFVAMGFSFGLNYLGSNILHIALIVLNVISGPIAGMFILGFFIPNANTKGALIGFTLAAIMTIWLGIGNVMTNIKLATRHANTTTNATNDTQCVPMLPVDRNLYKNRSGWDGFHSISYLWFGFIPIAIVFIFGSLISLITGGSSKNKRKYTIWKYKTIPLSPRNI
ncbi:sodium-dependent multivitamin transporter-like, partial [Argonauta hians]